MQYFNPRGVIFLTELAANNNKEWFMAHQSEYQKYLLDPFVDLTGELTPGMLDIDPALLTGAKTVSRIYRDTRFSALKLPYKTTMWLTFKRVRPDWYDAPAYFFELAADGYRFGMGYYSASSQTMSRFRRAVEEDLRLFQKIIAWGKPDNFTLEGDDYKKLKVPEMPDSVQEWYRKKSFYLVCNSAIGPRLFSRDLVNDLLDGFKRLAPLYHFLLKIKEAPER